MNSALQVLLNINEFILLFAKDVRINYKNKNGKSYGRVTNLFSELIIEKLSGEENVLEPIKLKKLIGELMPLFKGNGQQDSFEFLIFMLDCLHEDLNLISNKPYTENPDSLTYKGTEEELSNEIWANNLKRNCSFVNSFFTGQMKSTFECKKCSQSKVIYECFNTLCLPIPESKTIILNIVLHRLPITQKVYKVDDIKKFNSIKSISKDLVSNYEGIRSELQLIRRNSLKNNDVLISVEETPSTNIYESNLTISIPLTFKIQVSKENKFESIIQAIKNENLGLEKSRENTEFIMFFANFLLDYNMKIENFIQQDDTVIVYEVLNSYGLSKLLNISKQEISNEDSFRENCSLFTKDGDLLEYLSLYHSKTKEKEYLITIVNRLSKGQKRCYLFNPNQYQYLNLAKYYLIVSNKLYLTGENLYDLAWEKYEQYLRNSNLNDKKLWWKLKIDELLLDKETHFKEKCLFPFVIKIVKKNTFACSFCKWYEFCWGCAVNPFQTDIQLQHDDMLVVEWCNLAIKEINFKIVNLKFSHKTDIKVETNKDGYDIKECWNLNFKREDIDKDNAIYCSRCKINQEMVQINKISKLPPILIVALKRFKYNTRTRTKLNDMIHFDMDLNIEDFTVSKPSSYSLCSIICHDGSLSGGHYYCFAKVKDKNKEKWVKYNDSKVNDVDENEVLKYKSECYILVYKTLERIEDFDYYKLLVDLYAEGNNYFIGEPICLPDNSKGVVEKITNETIFVKPYNSSELVEIEK